MRRSTRLLSLVVLAATYSFNLSATANPNLILNHSSMDSRSIARAAAQTALLEQTIDITAFAERAYVIRRLDLASTETSVISFEPQHVNALVTIQSATGQVMTDTLLAGTYYLTFSNPGSVSRRQQVTVNDHQQVVIAALELQQEATPNPISITWTGGNLAYNTVIVRDGRFVTDISKLEPGEYTLAFVKGFSESVRFKLEAGQPLELIAPTGLTLPEVKPSTARLELPNVMNLLDVGSPVWSEVDLEKPLSPGSAGHSFQALTPPNGNANVGDLDCRDFPSQASAQTFFDGNGGVGYDRHDLDRDHDGIPCEVNEEWTIRRSEARPVSSVATQPTPTTPTTPTTVDPAPVTGPKKCWVNGYVKKNGTVVAGYWRDC
jgi:Excalibur calcium-binding domain